MQGLSNKEGIYLDRELAQKFYEFCFKDTKGYSATDTCPPSIFLQKHARFLKAHELLREKKGTRILIISEEDLIYDSRIHLEEFKEFIRWHKENNVKILRVDLNTADAIINKLGLRSSDVGIANISFYHKLSGSDIQEIHRIPIFTY